MSFQSAVMEVWLCFRNHSPSWVWAANFSTLANWRTSGSSLSRSASARLAPPKQKE